MFLIYLKYLFPTIKNCKALITTRIVNIIVVIDEGNMWIKMIKPLEDMKGTVSSAPRGWNDSAVAVVSNHTAAEFTDEVYRQYVASRQQQP